MKKAALLALACASLLCVGKAGAQEVTYVEDCNQGQLINPMISNWFFTVQGGANVLFSNNDKTAAFKDRIGASANIFFGKWFTPVWGFRFGASGFIGRGATTKNGLFVDPHHMYVIGQGDGVDMYPERMAGLGPEIDLMFNVTNWLCGYNPTRVYNAVLHAGGGAYWSFNHRSNESGWREADDRTLFANVGLQNNFRINKHIDLFLDVQASLIDLTTNDAIIKQGKAMSGILSAQIGFTYRFNKTGWNCPVTAVCPTWKYTDAEGDALVNRLANAENEIANLQKQLNDCLKRPTKECEARDVFANVYFPINVSKLQPKDKVLLEAISKTMLANPKAQYVLTGWADNYTGNDEINTRLRKERVASVKDYLVKLGVPAAQLHPIINDGNLTDFGLKGASFDRAVTIFQEQPKK